MNSFAEFLFLSTHTHIALTCIDMHWPCVQDCEVEGEPNGTAHVYKYLQSWNWTWDGNESQPPYLFLGTLGKNRGVTNVTKMKPGLAKWPTCSDWLTGPRGVRTGRTHAWRRGMTGQDLHRQSTTLASTLQDVHKLFTLASIINYEIFRII